MGLHSGPSLRSEVFLQKEDNMKVTLACFVLIWSVLAEVGNTLKCWDCVSNATSFDKPEDQTCPKDSRDTTLLTECNGDYCASLEYDGEFQFEVGCGDLSFEEVKENWEERFEEEPKMNGCVNTTDGNTYCFCDSSDGCNSRVNSSGVTQLSLFLFVFIVLTHLAF